MPLKGEAPRSATSLDLLLLSQELQKKARACYLGDIENVFQYVMETNSDKETAGRCVPE